MIKHLTLTHQ